VRRSALVTQNRSNVQIRAQNNIRIIFVIHLFFSNLKLLQIPSAEMIIVLETLILITGIYKKNIKVSGMVRNLLTDNDLKKTTIECFCDQKRNQKHRVFCHKSWMGWDYVNR